MSRRVLGEGAPVRNTVGLENRTVPGVREWLGVPRNSSFLPLPEFGRPQPESRDDPAVRPGKFRESTARKSIEAFSKSSQAVSGRTVSALYELEPHPPSYPLR